MWLVSFTPRLLYTWGIIETGKETKEHIKVWNLKKTFLPPCKRSENAYRIRELNNYLVINVFWKICQGNFALVYAVRAWIAGWSALPYITHQVMILLFTTVCFLSGNCVAGLSVYILQGCAFTRIKQAAKLHAWPINAGLLDLQNIYILVFMLLWHFLNFSVQRPPTRFFDSKPNTPLNK